MKETEKCQHCKDDYIPKRRGVQKFCSNSCRSRSWLLQQDKKKEKIEKSPKFNNPFTKENDKKLSEINKNVKSLKNNKPKKEGMTMAGAGESFFGTGAANLVTHLLTDPPTKNDINELKSIIKGARYFPINNFHQNEHGQFPYYDIETGDVVYG